MPYKSDAQRRFMHAVHPEIAKRWDKEMQRSIPEGETQDKFKPGSGFSNPDRIANMKNKARNAALKARVLQAKNGTAHEQHVAHEAHMQHVRNTTNANMKSKNPYNT